MAFQAGGLSLQVQISKKPIRFGADEASPAGPAAPPNANLGKPNPPPWRFN
jgi:hypothetical protein